MCLMDKATPTTTDGSSASTSSAIMVTNNNGQLAIPQPTYTPMPLMTKLLYYGVIPLIAPLFVTYKFITDKSYRVTTCNLYSLVSNATATNIDATNIDGTNITGTKNDGSNKCVMNGWYFQNVTLLKKLWTLKSAQVYIGNNILEYQVREGYCGSATQRCILKSFGYTSPSIIGIGQIGGESKPELWCEHVKLMTSSTAALTAASSATSSATATNDTTEQQVIVDSGNEEYYIETTIVYGSNVTYTQFKSILQTALSNTNVRIACNYLRSALTGFELVGLWKYHPLLILLKLYGGHFSPILGMLDADDSSDGENGDDHHDEGEEEKKEKECGNEEEEEGAADDDDGPFVAIWDTNAKYGGAYFVPCRRLYEAVSSVDVGSKKSRAIILVEKKKRE